jgi:hypothetical protein
VGVVYLAGFVVGIGGIGLIQSILGAPNDLATVSANSMTLAFAAILWLLAVVGDAAHGVLMFPILKQHNVRSIRADHVIDYTQEDFTENGHRYNLILAANGYHSISDYDRTYLLHDTTYAVVGFGEATPPRDLQFLVVVAGKAGNTTRKG